MITILVCGGRTYGRIDHLQREHMKPQTYAVLCERAKAERQFLNFTLNRLAKDVLEPVKFVAGEAKGADTEAKLFAQRNGYGYIGYKADWGTHKHAAGPIRNKVMYDTEHPKIVVGFCGDKGTSHMVNYARKRGCQHVLHYKEADIDNFMASPDFVP